MASQTDKATSRGCCKKNCFKKVHPLKIQTESRRDIVLKYVKVYPCKTRKVRDRFRPKNCYREYFLPGHHNDVKVCKHIFMRTVKCSSDFIDKTLCEVTKAITDNLEVDVNKTDIQQTSETNQATYLPEEGLSDIPLMVEEINNKKSHYEIGVSPLETGEPSHETVSPHETGVSPHETGVSPHETGVSPHETGEPSHETVSPHETGVSPHETGEPSHETVSPHETGVSPHETEKFPRGKKKSTPHKVTEQSADENIQSWDPIGDENILNFMDKINEDIAFEAVKYLHGPGYGESMGAGHGESMEAPTSTPRFLSNTATTITNLLSFLVISIVVVFVARIFRIPPELFNFLLICAFSIYAIYRFVRLSADLIVTMRKKIARTIKQHKKGATILFHLIMICIEFFYLIYIINEDQKQKEIHEGSMLPKRDQSHCTEWLNSTLRTLNNMTITIIKSYKLLCHFVEQVFIICAVLWHILEIYCLHNNIIIR